jgi:hypothetical protein
MFRAAKRRISTSKVALAPESLVVDLYPDGTFENRYVTYGSQAKS